MAGGGRLGAALLAVALLLCHGVLGALHQVSSGTAESAGVQQHHAPVVAPSAAKHHAEHDGGPVAHADYAAVLLVVLLGAVLALLLDESLTRSLAVVPHLFSRVFLRLLLRPPRGPTPILLQVFRL